MKKIFMFAAIFAALTVNAETMTWQATTAESVAQVNHKIDDPDNPGKQKTVIDSHGDVVCPAGATGTVIEAGIEGLEVKLMDGALDWEVMSNGVADGATAPDTFVGQDGVTYNKGYIQGGTNGMEGHLQHGSGISAHIELTPEVAGTVYVAAKFGKNKAIWAAAVPVQAIEDEEFSYSNPVDYLIEGYSTATFADGAVAAGTKMYPKEDGTGVSATEASADVYAALPLEVEPGYVYMFWVSGSKIMLSGISFTPSAPQAIENNAAAVKATKVVENGQLVIIKNGVRFNTVGARL